ncbi:unnamed protein product [Alopecurus aequalis]
MLSTMKRPVLSFPPSFASIGDFINPKKKAINSAGNKTLDSVAREEPPRNIKITYEYCIEITNDFSKKQIIHEDPFGTVYKATLEDGRTVAVKVVGEIGPLQGHKPFENDSANVTALNHKYIVKMIGYCTHTLQKEMHVEGRPKIVQTLICYEYFSNGSLHEILIGDYTRIYWTTRFNIITGICLGLLFLHTRHIIHLDLKPENIWVDENFVPKIANFGLSILLNVDQNSIKTADLVGSYGYMAPEYLYNGEISAMSDIYSLGLLIMEITTGEKLCYDINQGSSRPYIKNIQKDWTEQRIASKYSSLDAECLHQVNICIKVALACLEINPQNRPSIDKIVEKLKRIHTSREQTRDNARRHMRGV